MKNYNQFINDLSTLISINSEKTPSVIGKPFGEGVAKALETFLGIARRMGFETINYDNYMGEVRFGNGQEIGIIGHVDVVPAGTGWDTPPYQLTKKGDTYYGRGLSDDKGPLLVCLYALKELKDSNKPINKTFRLFVGCDEESGWQDVEYFNKHHSFPEYGFSPDGNFPVSYSEKGMAEITFTLPKLKGFSYLSGGTVVNAVCGTATAVADEKNIDKNLLEKYGLTLDGNKIISVGKSAHGSQPQLGVNAMVNLFKYFREFNEDVDTIINLLTTNFLQGLENEQGKTTLSGGLLFEDQKGVHITFDLRVPAPLTFLDAYSVLDKFGIPYTVAIRHEPVMVSKDGWFVNALISAYNSVMNENLSPVSMGGSTFARAFRKGCAFGMEFPNKSCGIHEPNEFTTEKYIRDSYKIYLTAFENLIK